MLAHPRFLIMTTLAMTLVALNTKVSHADEVARQPNFLPDGSVEVPAFPHPALSVFSEPQRVASGRVTPPTRPPISAANFHRPGPTVKFCRLQMSEAISTVST